MALASGYYKDTIYMGCCFTVGWCPEGLLTLCKAPETISGGRFLRCSLYIF